MHSVDMALLTLCSPAPALRGALGVLSLKQLCLTFFKPVHEHLFRRNLSHCSTVWCEKYSPQSLKAGFVHDHGPSPSIKELVAVLRLKRPGEKSKSNTLVAHRMARMAKALQVCDQVMAQAKSAQVVLIHTRKLYIEAVGVDPKFTPSLVSFHTFSLLLACNPGPLRR